MWRRPRVDAVAHRLHGVETDRARHGGQRRGRYRQSEQTYGQRVEKLRVREAGDGAGGQEAGQNFIDVRADLNDAAADEHRDEIAHRRAHVLGQLEPKAKIRHERQHGGQLHEHLQRASGNGAERQDDREPRQGSDVSPPQRA